MAHEVLYNLFGQSNRNWSRDLDDVAPIPPSPKLETAVDKKVKAQTAKLAATKAAADKGDKKAQKKWGKICKKVTRIQKAANAGNPDAARQMAKIRATGLFAATTTSGAFVGDSCPELEIRAAAGDVQAQQALAIQKATGQCSGDDKLTEILTSGDDKLTEILTSGSFVGRQEILGHNGFVGKDEILGRGQFLGEEERALAAEGGACERGALKRRFGKRTI